MKNIGRIVEHIENKQRADVIKSNVALQKELDKLININTRNGMVNATSFSRVVEMRVTDHTNDLLDTLLENIMIEEKRLNFMFPTNAINDIWDMTDMYLKNFISSNIRQGLLYALDHLSYNPDIFIHTLASNCEFKLKAKFEDMIFYNENTERDITEKEVKLSNSLSYLAIVIASISIYLHFA